MTSTDRRRGIDRLDSTRPDGVRGGEDAEPFSLGSARITGRPVGDADDVTGPAEEALGPDSPGVPPVAQAPFLPAWLDPTASAFAPVTPETGDSAVPEDDDWEDPGPRSRWRVLPLGAIALVVASVVAVLVTGFVVIGGDDGPPDVDLGRPLQPASGGRAPTSSTPSELVVSVVGMVHRPGLVRVTPATRVGEAIDAAGGARPGADLLGLNLAQPVRDGDQILVGYAGPAGRRVGSAVIAASGGAPGPGGPGPGASAPATDGVVDINTADAAALEKLPGVGPVTAKAIVDYRTANGRFASVDDLAKVDGIGPAKLAKLRDKARAS